MVNVVEESFGSSTTTVEKLSDVSTPPAMPELHLADKKLEASADPGEVFDTLLCLRDDVRDEQARLGVLNDCITQAKKQIEIKEEHVRVMEAEANDDLFAMQSIPPGICAFRNRMRMLPFGVWRRVSMSTKRRLVAELEALGEVEGAAKSLEHMRAIVGRDAITLGELEALWARAQVGAALKAGFVTDMEVQE
ncbi:hypothetical protein Tco_1295195 [Tanacetum coccineum]